MRGRGPDPAPDTNSRTGISFFQGGTNEINLIAMHNIIHYKLNGQKMRNNRRSTPLMQYNRGVVKMGPSLLKQFKHTSQGSTSTLVRLYRTSGFFKRPTEREFFLPDPRPNWNGWPLHHCRELNHSLANCALPNVTSLLPSPANVGGFWLKKRRISIALPHEIAQHLK